MINLNHGYHIDADAYNFVLFRDSGKTDKKGNALKENVTYHPTIGHALYRYMQEVQRNAVHDQEMNLMEAIDFFCALEATAKEIRDRLDEQRKRGVELD